MAAVLLQIAVCWVMFTCQIPLHISPLMRLVEQVVGLRFEDLLVDMLSNMLKHI